MTFTCQRRRERQKARAGRICRWVLDCVLPLRRYFLMIFPNWVSLQPLSGTYGPASKDPQCKSVAVGKSSSESQRPNPHRMHSPNPHAINGLSLPSWVRSQQKSPESTEQSDSLQLAVMIAMPQPRDRPRPEGEPDEYQIGVAHLPWGRDG
jgi:hypothetical protein